MPLTEADLDQVEARLTHKRARGQLPGDPVPPPGSFADQQLRRQDAARRERVAAARAEEERLRREREAAEERRRQDWERNAPQRAQAAAELTKLEEELARLDTEREGLAERASELQEVAAR